MELGTAIIVYQVSLLKGNVKVVDLVPLHQFTAQSIGAKSCGSWPCTHTSAAGNVDTKTATRESFCERVLAKRDRHSIAIR